MAHPRTSRRGRPGGGPLVGIHGSEGGGRRRGGRRRVLRHPAGRESAQPDETRVIQPEVPSLSARCTVVVSSLVARSARTVASSGATGGTGVADTPRSSKRRAAL